jgi:hypothetical protein
MQTPSKSVGSTDRLQPRLCRDVGRFLFYTAADGTISRLLWGRCSPAPTGSRRKAVKRRSCPYTTSWKSSWTSTSKRPVLATSQALFCSRAPWAKPGSYRAGRWCVPMPRTCLKDDSNKPDCRLTIRRIHSATGITNFLENDGTLEAAQRIAGHADSRTTKLYDRRGQKVLLDIWRGSGT